MLDTIDNADIKLNNHDIINKFNDKPKKVPIIYPDDNAAEFKRLSVGNNITVMPRHNTDNEVKSVKIIMNLIDKYKSEIPLIYNTIKVQEKLVPDYKPGLLLTTKPIHYKYSNQIFLYLLIHENLRKFAANIKPIKKTVLAKKYKSIFDNDINLRKSVSNKFKIFIDNMIIVYNELIILHKVIKSPRHLKYIYKYFSKDSYIRQWILNNLDELKINLTELNLIWKK